MNFSDAFKSIIKPQDKDKLTPLFTSWGENLDSSNVLPKYPRPQMRRDSFINLNGYWDYAITNSADFPNQYEGQILVPFSPEAALSGVNRQLKPDEFLWYRTILPLQDRDKNAADLSHMRLLLHFGAVDYQAEVYINNRHVITHLGGYLPFFADITDFLDETDNQLIIKVQDTTDQDSQARGKQTLHRGGIFYTAQSGIWQSVWMEWVPSSHIESLWFETDYDNRKVTAHINFVTDKALPALSDLSMSVFCDGSEIQQQRLSIHPSDCAEVSSGSLSFHIPEESFYAWSPEDPFLYDVKITLGSDCVQSYFAMRCYSIEKPSGQPEEIPVFCLNHKPYFLMDGKI